MAMTEYIIELISVITKTSMPFLLASVAVGLVIALVQAVTQVQEQTLPQIAKIILIVSMGLNMMSLVGSVFLDFTDMVLRAIPTV